jgi:hypothetical protein
MPPALDPDTRDTQHRVANELVQHPAMVEDCLTGLLTVLTHCFLKIVRSGTRHQAREVDDVS